MAAPKGVSTEEIVHHRGTGLSNREIGNLLGISDMTVGYHLKKAGLRSVRDLKRYDWKEVQDYHDAGRSRLECLKHFSMGADGWRDAVKRGELIQHPKPLYCERHPDSEFRLPRKNAKTPRCSRCMYEDVARHRNKTKDILVAEAGGSCIRCGYNKCMRSLHFHHRPGEKKEFAVRSNVRSLDKLREEAGKCDLLCANCHGEVHDETDAILISDRQGSS